MSEAFDSLINNIGGVRPGRRSMQMMHKDIQALEHAARTAMAGNDDPLPAPQRALKPAHVGLAFLMIAGAAYLFLV